MRDTKIALFCLLLTTALFAGCGGPSMRSDDPAAGLNGLGQFGAGGAFVDPGLRRQGNKIFGEGVLFPEADGSGLLLGIGRYAFITDRGLSPEKMREIICMIGGIGMNHFRTFTALGVTNNRGVFVSPWENTTEWQSRRDALLDAGADCGVYIQLSLFDEVGRNDAKHDDGRPRRGEGYSSKDNSWRGEDPSLDLAKKLTEQVYLAGIDPTSRRGKVLIVEHFNEPNEGDWNPDWSEPFDTWLKQKGFQFTAGNAADGSGTYKGGDKIEVHWDDTIDSMVSAARSVRQATGKAPAISTDGGSLYEENASMMPELVQSAISNRISLELMANEPLKIWDADAPITTGSGFSGTTREYLRQFFRASGVEPGDGGPIPAPSSGPTPTNPPSSGGGDSDGRDDPSGDLSLQACNEPGKNDATVEFAKRLTDLLFDSLLSRAPLYLSINTDACQHYRELVRARNEGRDVKKQFVEEAVKMVGRSEFTNNVLANQSADSIQSRIYQKWFGTTPFRDASSKDADQQIKDRIESAKGNLGSAPSVMGQIVRDILSWPDFCDKNGWDIPSGCTSSRPAPTPTPKPQDDGGSDDTGEQVGDFTLTRPPLNSEGKPELVTGLKVVLKSEKNDKYAYISSGGVVVADTDRLSDEQIFVVEKTNATDGRGFRLKSLKYGKYITFCRSGADYRVTGESEPGADSEFTISRYNTEDSVGFGNMACNFSKGDLTVGPGNVVKVTYAQLEWNRQFKLSVVK